MTTTNLFRTAACALSILTAGCGLLDVSDPTRIEEADIANGASAVMMRGQALHQLYRALPFLALYGGMMTDEFLADPSAGGASMHVYEQVDRRWRSEVEGSLAGSSTYPYTELATARFRAAAAIPELQAYAPAAVKGPYIGHMFAVRGFATMTMAENFCPGFPLNEAVDGRFIPGDPLSTTEIFESALAEFDSALIYAADSARFLNFARVGRARTLLGLGRFAEAADAAEPVPTDYVIEAEYQPGSGATNYLAWLGSASGVADREAGTGLDFVSTDDPRVELVFVGEGNDETLDIYTLAKYPSTSAPLVIASGIEARLIEAEAALAQGDPSWLTILNDLRRTQVSPALSDTTDPGTDVARLDLLFRERAFWLFGTGHRLGDLRRLVRLYGRAAEEVFPAGAYRLGGTYETGTSLPFPTELEARQNPAVTGCTSD